MMASSNTVTTVGRLTHRTTFRIYVRNNSRSGRGWCLWCRGFAATKQGLLEWVHDFGLKALDELMRDDAARIVGEC
jgi:hypothetical protein